MSHNHPNVWAQRVIAAFHVHDTSTLKGFAAAAREIVEAEVRSLAAAPGEFERGWLQGREQEKALWELTAAGQAIENLEDAQNYRWLRDRAINHEAFGEHLAWCVIGTSANDCRPCQGAELDAVIALARAADAAIR